MLKFLLIAAGVGIGAFAIFCIVYYFRYVKEPSDTQVSYSSASSSRQEPFCELNGVYVFHNNPAHIYYIKDGKYFGEFYINKFNNRCMTVGIVKRFSENTFLIEHEDLLFYRYDYQFSTFINTPHDHNYFAWEMHVYVEGEEIYTNSDVYAKAIMDENPIAFREKVRRCHYKSRCYKVSFPDFYAYESHYRKTHFSE